jgi:hypothetical protein
VIKLKDPNNVASTIADITDNPKKLRFVELDAAQLPRSLQDVDLVSINNNYAVQVGLNPAVDAIAREAADGPWVNIIAVREEDKDKPWVKQLVDAYHSEPVKDFLEKRFKGTYIATALIRSDYVETIDNARTFRSGSAVAKLASAVSSGIFAYQVIVPFCFGTNSPLQMATISECRSRWGDIFLPCL